MDGMYLGGTKRNDVPDRQSPCPIQCMFDLQGPTQDLVGQGLCRESVNVCVSIGLAWHGYLCWLVAVDYWADVQKGPGTPSRLRSL